MAANADNSTQRLSRFERRRRRETDVRVLRADAAMKRHKRKQKRSDLARAILSHGARARKGRTGTAYHQDAEQLAAAVRNTKLADPRCHIVIKSLSRQRTYAHALSALLEQRARWIRRPEDWECRSHNPQRQFASLARHLLCRFDPPACLDAAWFCADPKQAKREQEWFIWTGLGHNLRKAEWLPLELTRRAAHLLGEAPATMTVSEALRWAQLRALGANDRLAHELMASRMGCDFARDAFWLTVARFFIDHPRLNLAQVRPIIDYIHNQRFVEQLRVWDGRRWEHPGVPEPNFTMRGRTMRTLRCQTDLWHAELRRRRYFDASLVWPASDVRGLERREGDGADVCTWRVRELTTARELADEGGAMRHCVAMYAQSCHRGETAIFSMTRSTREGIERMITIEVELATRLIVQARGKRNVLPEGPARRVLGVWATEAGLAVHRM